MPDSELTFPRLDISFALASAVASKQLSSKPDPLDEKIDTLLLDLSKSEPQHARSVLKSIATAIAPQLYLQAEKSWILATGTLSPTEAARIIAEQFLALGYQKTSVAIIQGESFINRLEELVQEGADLRDETGCSLIDYTEIPLSVLTNAPAEPITEALSEGAQIVITQMALPGSMALAAYGNQLTGASLPPKAAASIAAAAQMLSQRGQVHAGSQSNADQEVVIARTNNQGACYLDNLSETATSNFSLDSKLACTLPEISYESQWQVESSHKIRLESIECETSDETVKLAVTLPEKFRAEFKAQFANPHDYENWEKRLQSVASPEIKFLASKLATSDETEYFVTLESKQLSQLKSFTQQIELLSLASHGGPYLSVPASDAIREAHRYLELSISSRSALDTIEFQHQMRTVEDWMD